MGAAYAAGIRRGTLRQNRVFEGHRRREYRPEMDPQRQDRLSGAGSRRWARA